MDFAFTEFTEVERKIGLHNVAPYYCTTADFEKKKTHYKNPPGFFGILNIMKHT
jgi:hypothetical protein